MRSRKDVDSSRLSRQNPAVDQPRIRRQDFRLIATVCASLTLLVALLTFVGWISGLQLLASVRARYIPMAPSTAVCFSLLAIGILLNSWRAQFAAIAQLLAGAVLIFALGKLVEFLSGRPLGIDAWFVRNPEMFGVVPTGRMAPLTALDFVFSTLGLFALTRKGLVPWSGLFGALATGLSAIILVGYWYGTPLLYGGTIIPVALSTGWAFFLCGIAILASAGRRAWPLDILLGDSTRAVLLRSFVPVIVAAALLND